MIDIVMVKKAAAFMVILLLALQVGLSLASANPEDCRLIDMEIGERCDRPVESGERLKVIYGDGNTALLLMANSYNEEDTPVRFLNLCIPNEDTTVPPSGIFNRQMHCEFESDGELYDDSVGQQFPLYVMVEAYLLP